MKVEEFPVERSLGHILLHTIVTPEGKRIASKGKTLDGPAIDSLSLAGVSRVWVGVPEPGDVQEDGAATELGGALAGPGLSASPPRGGRVDLLAASPGLFQVDTECLLKMNLIPGIGIATAQHNTLAAAGQRVVSVKVIPYAIGREKLDEALSLCRGAPVLALKPFVIPSAVLITVGPEGTHPDLEEAFGPSLGGRLGMLGISLNIGPRALESLAEIRTALEKALAGRPGMILIAGHNSVVDPDDRVPRALRSAGAEVVRHGIPTEPGSLLLLAYWGSTPVVGLAGCARSPKRNGVDLVLARVAAGERLEPRDLASLGHGGLLG